MIKKIFEQIMNFMSVQFLMRLFKMVKVLIKEINNNGMWGIDFRGSR